MVRLIALLTILIVVYYLYNTRQQPIDAPLGYVPSIITVKELPPIREENE